MHTKSLMLQALVASGQDLRHEEVPLVSPDGDFMAALTLTVVAAAALRGVAQDGCCS